MDNRGLMRRKLLEEIYDKMSPEDKRLFVYLTLDNKDHKEIMDALSKQSVLINNIAKRVERQNWYVDFGSDILANITTDSFIWLFNKIFKRR